LVVGNWQVCILLILSDAVQLEHVGAMTIKGSIVIVVIISVGISVICGVYVVGLKMTAQLLATS